MSPSMLPSRQRLAGAGLAIAALTIIALAALTLADLQREAALHREVLAAQVVKDNLDRVRTLLQELRAGARFGALTGDADTLRGIERGAAEIDDELATLARNAAAGVPLPNYEALAAAARLLATHARSVGFARGAQSDLALAQEAARLEALATTALDRSDAAVTTRINERTMAQIRLGEGLRKYVAWLLVGSIAVLLGLFAGYRRAQTREREAQKRIEHLAHFDTLTGLPNRALLADRLAQETARARRSSHGFAVLLFDLDGFKSVNDTWGHAAGDRVLAIVAERVRKCVRASDTVGRLGGDEFLAILPETTLEGALGVAEKLRESLSEPYALGQEKAKLSASVGMSLFPDHGSHPEALQRAADTALYRAKREGRNRTVVAAKPAHGAAPGTDAKNAA